MDELLELLTIKKSIVARKTENDGNQDACGALVGQIVGDHLVNASLLVLEVELELAAEEQGLHIFGLGWEESESLLILLVLDEKVDLERSEHGLVDAVLELRLLLGLVQKSFGLIEAAGSHETDDAVDIHGVSLALSEGFVFFKLCLDTLRELLEVQRTDRVLEICLIEGIDLVQSIDVHFDQNVVLDVLWELEPAVLLHVFDLVLDVRVNLSHLIQKVHLLHLKPDKVLLK